MWMFLATEVLFFGGLFGAYACYRLWYAAEFEYASSFMNLKFASINTVFLVTSSLTMTLAIRCAKLGDKAGLYRNLLLTFALGSAFMVLKGFEYAEDFHEHILPGTSSFGGEIKHDAEAQGLDTGKVRLFLCFYYIMTGIHGVHIIIGLGCILWLVQQTYANKIPPENYSTVEVVSLYWHLVDAIWLFLMPMLYLAGAHIHHVAH
ncbi:MAG: cytochrome C oxidase subunit III [Planctomycetaceae bacterium]|nr:cytochrome C oxidase subunit III [Planctomycetaceae bacterium]